jgi:ferrous iron transport protein B
MRVHDDHPVQRRLIALVGNPNSGKTTLFNALTGMRQKVGNYPGVTVEKKEGRTLLADGSDIALLDLPGTYSLTPHSPDEKITTDVLLGHASHTRVPDLVVCVVDASNLERNLYLVSQLIDRHLPVVIALNMIDVAERGGARINVRALERELGVRVIPTVASKGTGVVNLKAAMRSTIRATGIARAWRLPEPVEKECQELVGLLQEHHHLSPPVAFHEAITLLAAEDALTGHSDRFAPELLQHVKKDHEKLDFLGFDRHSLFVESRYEWVKQVCARAVTQAYHPSLSASDRVDRILTHKVWGLLIFLGLMALVFQSIFSWATIPMDWITGGFDWLGHHVTLLVPPGDLRDLIVNGAIAGVSAVVSFLPQILFLFLFLGLLEDTGYMARAAFIMDRIMSTVGLHGKSFIPLLSSFACAIPGIMATRTIENPRDRLTTMLVAPLISCSARLPVYTLLIAAFIPPKHVLGVFSLPAMTLLALYLTGLLAAVTVAWLLKKTLLKGAPPVFIMELPPYKIPSWKSIMLHMWERSVLFVKRAGTILLGVSIILWFLGTYPKLDGATPAEQLTHSFAGKAGHLIEPLIRPLGFDWKIGVGLIGSLLQREVFVSTMGTMYNIHAEKTGNGSVSLREHLHNDRDPVTGRPTFTILTALCLMVYYALAMQCMSTVAVLRRETNSWKWPLFQFTYMNSLAYGATFLLYRVGLLLGIGA